MLRIFPLCSIPSLFFFPFFIFHVLSCSFMLCPFVCSVSIASSHVPSCYVLYLMSFSFVQCSWNHLTYATRNIVSFLSPLICFSFVFSSFLFLVRFRTSKIEPNMYEIWTHHVAKYMNNVLESGVKLPIFWIFPSRRVQDEWFGSKLTPIRAQVQPPRKTLPPPQMAHTRKMSPKGFIFRPPRNPKMRPKSNFWASASDFYFIFWFWGG